MRHAPAIVAVSVGVHLGTAYLITRALPPPLPVAVGLPPAPPPAAAAPEPIAVELLGDDAPAPTRVVGSSGGRGVAHASTGGSSHGGTGTEAPGTPGGSRYFKMRGPELGIGGDFVASFLANSKPLEAVAKSGRVEAAGPHGAVIHDRVTTVEIERDGTAHFRDKRDFDIHLELPIPTLEDLRAMGRGLAAWYEDPYRDQRAGRVSDKPRHITAVPGACDKFGDAWCEIPEATMASNGAPVPIAGGTADISAYLQRKLAHSDPYASRKLALLDATRAERAEAGGQFRAEQLDHSAQLMQKNLAALWLATIDPAARRDALFALWDECAEGEGPIGEAGQRARLIVIGWIRSRLPAESPDAFTPDDIARRDAHRISQQHFAPY